MRWLLADVRLPDKVIMLNILTLAVLMNAHKLALVIVNCSCYVYIPTMIDVHLFLHCPFAQSCWSTIGLNVGHTDPFPTLKYLRTQLNVPLFMEVIILLSWSIWMQRNDCIFKGIQPNHHNCRSHFIKEFTLVILRAKLV